MDVIMPQLGETVPEGSVSAWLKKVGDAIQADEPLFEVETEKVTTEIPAPITGVLTAILVEVGVSVKVGTPLAVIEGAGVASPQPAPTIQRAAAVAALAVAPAVVAAPLPRGGAGGPKLSPVVRRLLAQYALRVQDVAGTGRDQRITREDVLEHSARVASAAPSVAAPAAAVTPALPAEFAAPTAVPLQPVQAQATAAAVAGSDDRVVPLNRIRRATGAHMVRSLATSPHTLQAVEVDFHAVERVRRARGAEWKAREGFSLTYLPFIARAVCDAIARYPHVNASLGHDALIVHKRVHLGIAVDLDFDGLVATVIRDADHRSLRGLALEIHRLAEAARRGALKPDDLSGGTYTLSNSGSFGTFFTASIINQPQVAILSTDGVRKKPVVIEGPQGDAIAIRPVGVLAQSFDHRAFDGAYSAAFLRHLKDILEGRDWMAEVV